MDIGLNLCFSQLSSMNDFSGNISLSNIFMQKNLSFYKLIYDLLHKIKHVCDLDIKNISSIKIVGV